MSITTKGVDPFADWLLDHGYTEVTREIWLFESLGDLPDDLNDLDPELEASLPGPLQLNPPVDY